MNPGKTLLLSLGFISVLVFAALSTTSSSDADPARRTISVVEGKSETIFKEDPLGEKVINRTLTLKHEGGGDDMAGSGDTAVEPENGPSDLFSQIRGRKLKPFCCSPIPSQLTTLHTKSHKGRTSKHKEPSRSSRTPQVYPSDISPPVSAQPHDSGGLTVSIKIKITLVCISASAAGVVIAFALKMFTDYIRKQSAQPPEAANAGAGDLSITTRIQVTAVAICSSVVLGVLVVTVFKLLTA